MATGAIIYCLVWFFPWTSLAVMSQLPVKYSWSTVDFVYNDQQKRDQDLRSGNLNTSNVVILDSDYFCGTYFATTPPVIPGSPATLSSLSNMMDAHGSRLLKPFPDWSWQSRSSCDGIIAAFRIKIDQMGRMWVIDCGVLDVFTANPRFICPPKLLAFDLKKNNTLITKYVFPPDQVSNASYLLNLEVQLIDDNTFVYIADVTTSRMVVYNFGSNNSHAIEHPYFRADPAYTYFNINGAAFNLSDGIFSMAIYNAKDIMYFHSLSSGYEYYVNAKILRKSTPLTDEDRDQFKRFSYQKENHTSSEVVTKEGELIFATLEDSALYTWDTKTCYGPQNFNRIAQNNVTLQFVTGMKAVGKDVLVTSSRLQNVIAYGANAKGEVNFRILQGNIANLLQGCDNS